MYYVPMWGCINVEAVGPLLRIAGSLTAERYLDTVKEHAIPAGHRLISEHFIFQQDHDLKHSVWIVTQYFNELAEQGITETMIWPPKSPDHNIIEDVWDYTEKSKQKRNPGNVNALFSILEEERNRIL